MSFLLSIEALKNKLDSNKQNLRVIDVRYQLSDPEAGRKAYVEGHIPGAVYLDLKKDLSSEKGLHGGSHPLPNKDELASKLSDFGMDHTTEVIIYDEHNDMFSARCLWLFHHMGHENAKILEGGWKRWKESGLEVETEIPRYHRKEFAPKEMKKDTVSIHEVKEKMNQNTAILIDSRGHDRYLGNTEPMYSKAGHIPGAKNYFWKDVLDNEGNWKDRNELEKQFEDLPKNQEIIVSCGSGVSACPNVLALKQLGFEDVKLYPGSFSDWISYEDNPVETREE